MCSSHLQQKSAPSSRPPHARPARTHALARARIESDFVPNAYARRQTTLSPALDAACRHLPLLVRGDEQQLSAANCSTFLNALYQPPPANRPRPSAPSAPQAQGAQSGVAPVVASNDSASCEADKGAAAASTSGEPTPSSDAGGTPSNAVPAGTREPAAAHAVESDVSESSAPGNADAAPPAIQRSGASEAFGAVSIRPRSSEHEAADDEHEADPDGALLPPKRARTE